MSPNKKSTMAAFSNRMLDAQCKVDFRIIIEITRKFEIMTNSPIRILNANEIRMIVEFILSGGNVILAMPHSIFTPFCFVRKKLPF